MTQPLPPNLDPSQCYRILDPERDTLQMFDEIQDESSTNGWRPIDPEFFGKEPEKGCTYRRSFTPPAPVQVQEFWRLLDVGEARQLGDQFQYPLTSRWFDISPSEVGKSVLIGAPQHRRRVTVPVAAPAPVADAGPVESLKSFADQEASRIVKAFADAPKAEPSGDYAAYRQRLLKYLDQDLGWPQIESELDEIERIVLSYWAHKPHEPITSQPQSGPYLVSVDGHEAPTMEHDTIEDARIEAERLARQEHPAQVRLLRQVAVAKADVTVKWDNNQTK